MLILLRCKARRQHDQYPGGHAVQSFLVFVSSASLLAEHLEETFLCLRLEDMSLLVTRIS